MAVAAAKLGAIHVDAVEIDPDAIPVAKKNSHVNSCDNLISFYCGGREVVPLHPYDLIVANITADVHVLNVSPLLERLSPRSQLRALILSGISDHRKDEMDAFLASERLVVQEKWYESGWSTYVIDVSQKKKDI